MDIGNLVTNNIFLSQKPVELKRNQRQNNLVPFSGNKDTYSKLGNIENKEVKSDGIEGKKDSGILDEVRKINLSKDRIDSTIKGFYELIETKIKFPGFIEVNGKKIELPNLDSPKECSQWWDENISRTPLSVDAEDRKKAAIISELPSVYRNKFLSVLSGVGKKLTVYDNKALLKYRAELEKRRYLIRTKEAKETQKAKVVIDNVSKAIYDKYEKQGINKDKNKRLIVMIGQKAAGKTTLVDKMREKYGVMVADSDEIREFIGTQETELHGRLKSGIKNKLADMAIKDGANYLAQFHGTGTKGPIELIKKFTKEGYKVTIINLEVPESELVKRIQKRKKMSGKDADPLAVVLCGQKEQLANFQEIAEKGKVDKAKRFDNNVPYGTFPVEIK